jgi:hypothetical protein
MNKTWKVAIPEKYINSNHIHILQVRADGGFAGQTIINMQRCIATELKEALFDVPAFCQSIINPKMNIMDGYYFSANLIVKSRNSGKIIKVIELTPIEV